MCEFCGCDETVKSGERHLTRKHPKGKALDVRVKAAPAGPKSASRVTTDLHEKPRSAREELTAKHV